MECLHCTIWDPENFLFSKMINLIFFLWVVVFFIIFFAGGGVVFFFFYLMGHWKMSFINLMGHGAIFIIFLWVVGKF